MTGFDELAAGGDGLEFIAFGAPLDAPYEPPSWG